jgi:hypothetical protein
MYSFHDFILGYPEFTEPIKLLQWLQKIQICTNNLLLETRGNTILTIPEKLDTIRRLESHENQRDVTVSHNNQTSTIYNIKEWNDQIRSFMASGIVKGLLNSQTLEQPKLAQMDNVLLLLASLLDMTP